MTDANAITADLNIQNIEGELVVDSRLVSASLGILHRSFFQTIRDFQAQIEKEFGFLRFKDAEIDGKGRPQKYVLLNEDQAIFLVTLSRNTAQVVSAKISIVKAFSKARKILSGKLDMVELARIQVALEYEKDSYRPWRKANPESDPYFRKLVAIPAQPIEPEIIPALPNEAPQRIIPNSVEFLPDPEAQKMIEKLLEIIDQMSLAANRAGLAGNKSIKEAEFLAKQLDKVREFFGDQESKIERLNEALKDSEFLIADQNIQIERLQKALRLAQANSDIADTRAKGLDEVRSNDKAEIERLNARIRRLEAESSLQNTALTLSSGNGNGNSFLGLPPAA